MNTVRFYGLVFFLISFCDNVLCFQFTPFQTFKKYTWCYAFECCSDEYIPARFDILKASLDEKLYGQHLVKQVVVDALAAHFAESNPQKALTLSFHGWPGSGKNYVTKFIKEALYKEGSQSNFVHHFTARLDFPLEKDVLQYQSDLQNWIRGNISSCERSLFIFDEVDKMPANLLNAIKPMIDYSDFDKINYRKAVYIFLSNTGGGIIKDHLLNLWERGVKRKDIKLRDFENIIAKGAFNERGGFYMSDTIKSNLIDHYVPFFPLEKEHVELCVQDSFHSKGIYGVSDELIKEAMEIIEWGPEPTNIFSTTGCKRLSQKVPIIIRKHGLKSNAKTEL